MIVTPAAGIAGYEITETLGLVRGNTIRTRHLGRDITAVLKGLIGGEIEEYTKMMGQSREQALARLRDEAQALRADAVTDIRFSTSFLMSSAAEILVYGNAVKIAKA